jgi:uncharacterized protein YPO0396
MQDLIDFATDNARAGFRLHKMEVLNWGTFHRKAWKIAPQGSNSLLTGDIGSGKSTLVDAITTLLVPHHKIVYNKAAGAESKERSLYSYIRGEFKNEKDESSQASRKVYLRDENTYSVLLANFQNEGYNASISIAQVFWLRNNKPEKFFVIADVELNLLHHFSNFGADIATLKRNLKKEAHVEVYESFKDYSNTFRHKFGIKSENALELFYQTVSMKSIGNLTDFVQNQMLEKPDVKEKIEELIRNFDNLSQAHESVQKAKKQLLQLEPLMEEAAAFEKIGRQIHELQKCLEALPVYFSLEKKNLLEGALEKIEKDLRLAEEQLRKMSDELDALREKASTLSSAIDHDKEGQRIREIEQSVRYLQSDKEKKRNEFEQYQQLSQQLDLPEVLDESSFKRNHEKLLRLKHSIAEEQQQTVLERDKLKITLNDLEKVREADQLELESLKKRKTQIPDANLAIRNRIAHELELSETELPFVGELLKVREGENDWEGAIERLLHNFGLSILLSDDIYKRVSHYINKTNLKGRIVYYRVSEQEELRPVSTLNHHSLLHKLEIKGDTPFYNWIEQELYKRFNLACCETIEDFYREPNAITREGQIKSGKFRHEKDDRRSILDRRNYILGWSNQEKIQAIARELQLLEEKIGKQKNSIQLIDQYLQKLSFRSTDLHDMLKFGSFEEINWQQCTSEIQALLEEKTALEQSSDKLRVLKEQLELVKKQIRSTETEKDNMIEGRGGLNAKKEDYVSKLKECNKFTQLLTQEEQQTYFPLIEKRMPVFEASLQNIDSLQEEVREKISKKSASQFEAEGKLKVSITKKMLGYKRDYPAETGEVDDSVEAIPEFRSFAEKLKKDDLPKHEQRFKKLLNEGTIQGILIFKTKLDQFELDIEDKIKKINESLVEIEYNPGTYIKLNSDRNQDADISQFKFDLRNCLENTLGETDLYNEEKFLQVKQILDRFRSGESKDILWTQKVTDVRNWFRFTASERWKEDHSEKEFYSDSSGKSGGQKEKLAYTILASALAYQFGMEWGSTKSRSFRFVVIDEAFGRGSDDSTRYGLQLFEKLNLQLLIVTPLQKINIIEDYIDYVHFVSNPTGQDSVVRDLSKSEYVQEKAKHLNLNTISITS